MSGKTYPAQMPLSARSFYGESPPKRSRLHDTGTIKPAFKTLKDNLIKFDRKLSEPIKGGDLKKPAQPADETSDESKSLDRESPLPLKNLGNTCYENSIIQCLFSLGMFMDNFQNSMKRVKCHVIKQSKPLIEPTTDSSFKSESQKETLEITNDAQSTTDSTPTIIERDVRFRIADAFDKLYKSYTQKRIQIETLNKNIPSSNQNNEQDEITNPTSDYAISNQSSSAISLCKSSNDTSSIPTSSEENHKSVSPALTPSNLTPIALVSSSTPNEQSEIETRLEDLKSAVGERSSQFNSTHQQDASEFFYHVIDSIQEFYQSLGRSSDDDNPVTKAFELELDYLINCPKCNNRIFTGPEKIRTLSLALPHVNNECSSNQVDYNHVANVPTPPTSDLGSDSPDSLLSSDEQRTGSDEKENLALVDEIVPEDNSNNTVSIAKLGLTDKAPQKSYTLCDALNNYFKDDLLDYSCSQTGCDSKQRTRKCLIRKLPQILFITLARYSYTGKKNLDEIEAPFELSVPFRENKSPSHSPSAHRDFHDDDTYQLVAVVCHLGSSLNAGHYTSYVYNQNNFSWYSCDDDSITRVQEDDVKDDVRKTGYCFFYAHKSCL